MKGRLNLFQAAILRWRALHPYNAVHVVRVCAAASTRCGSRRRFVASCSDSGSPGSNSTRAGDAMSGTVAPRLRDCG